MRREPRRLLDARADLVRRDALADQRKADIAADIHVRIEREQLEDEGDVALDAPLEGDVLAAEENLARRRQLEAGDHPQRRRLAAARGTEQTEELIRRRLVKEESFTATKSPNAFLRFSTRISAMAHSGNFETT